MYIATLILTLQILASLAASPAMAQGFNSYAIEPKYEKGNYVSDVRLEDPEVGVPLVLIPVPESLRSRIQIKDQIFDHKLSAEFQSRYQDQFGRSQEEVAYRNSEEVFYALDVNGDPMAVQRNSDAQRDFGNYMFRRMAEYHFENYSKTNENLHKVQQVKEQVTNYQVSVAPGYSVKANYSISGNFIDVNLINPYVESRARLEMNPAAVGPSPLREARLMLGREITSTVKIESHYKVYDGIAQLITRKQLTSLSYLSLTGSTYTKPSGPSTREHLGLVGYGRTF